MSVRGSWRVSLRLARRDILRAKGRTALVALMIGVPVFLVAAMSVFLRSTDASSSAADLRSLGAAEARVEGIARGPVKQDPTDKWTYEGGDSSASPWTAAEVAKVTGGKVASLRTGSVLLSTEVGGLGTAVRELDLRDPLTEGLGEITAGRAPQRANEVLVSPLLVDRGFGVGTSVKVRNGKTYDVVGVVRNPEDLESAQLVALPGTVLGADAKPPVFLVSGHPIEWKQVRELNKLGLLVRSRAVMLDPPPLSQVEPSIAEITRAGADSNLPTVASIGAIVMLEIILLAGPAFAVGARRQGRQLAQFVVAGATPKDVRRIVLAQALVLGFGTAALSCVLGIAAYLAARPAIENVYGKAIPEFTLNPYDLGGLLVAGVVAAVVAALAPAIQAARQDTVAVLGGRRGEVRTRRRWPLAGAVIATAGLVALVGWGFRTDSGRVVVIAGTVALALGAILMMPTVVGLAGRLAGRLPLALRLAARDTSRHRTRTVPAVAAIMGTVITVTALSILFFSTIAAEQRDYVPRERMGALTAWAYTMSDTASAEAVRAIDQELRGRKAALLRDVSSDISEGTAARLAIPGAGCAGPDFAECELLDDAGLLYQHSLAVTDAQAHRFQTGRPLTPEQADVLAKGGVLVPVKSLLTARGTAYLETFDPKSAGDGTVVVDNVKRFEVPAAYDPPSIGPEGDTIVYPGMVGERVVERFGLTAIPTKIVVPPGEPAITKDQQARIIEVLNGLTPFAAEVYVERGYDDPLAVNLFIVFALAGGLIILIGTATSTALALDDARADFATLAAVGAAPGTRRRAAMGQAFVIAALGVVAGVAVGLVPGIALAYPFTGLSEGGLAIDIPWELLGVLAVGVPLVAILGAGALTKARLPLVRRAD